MLRAKLRGSGKDKSHKDTIFRRNFLLSNIFTNILSDEEIVNGILILFFIRQDVIYMKDRK